MRTIRFCALAGLLFGLAFPARHDAAEPISRVPAGAAEKARALLQKEIGAKVPGFSAAVAVNGALVWSESSGYADLANRIKVTSRTRFRIGSISKPLTAAALALLVERGQLDLDAPIQTYIPDFPKKSSPITVRLLAGHLRGLRDYRPGEGLSDVAYPDARSRLKIFEADPLEAPPGERFHYSSYNWCVIEVAMERASHQDFISYMHANVIKPLRLDDTCAEQTDSVDPQRTRFYEVDPSGVFVIGPHVDNRYAWAAGVYLSTAEDLVRFGSALLAPGFLKASSLKMLFTSQVTAAGEPTGYGVGWFIWHQRVIYHSGESVGGVVILLLLPASHIVAAILTNRGNLQMLQALQRNSQKPQAIGQRRRPIRTGHDQPIEPARNFKQRIQMGIGLRGHNLDRGQAQHLGAVCLQRLR